MKSQASDEKRANMSKQIKIGTTTQDNGEGASTWCGIKRVDRKEDGIEFVAMTHQGERKVYASAAPAAKFLASRGFTAEGKRI
jgi:hypothetical protein